MVSVSTTISARTRTLVWAGRLCVGLPAAVGHARINLRDRGSRSLNPPCSHATLKTKSAFCGQATRAQMTGSCTLVPKTEADKKEARKSISSVLNAFEARMSLIVSEARLVRLARPMRRPLATTLSNGSVSRYRGHVQDYFRWENGGRCAVLQPGTSRTKLVHTRSAITTVLEVKHILQTGL